ncbi:hypothetical protein PsorP6_006245 [Peronosclerospora sorghi]|uniref:Uncharacterized protein n=1 Tax=Peronosclerospora sorghi TaxID=230839 RepID=A0ACC0W6X9_9STRA|nr:hypothetical protein PsorP6_006245 [Peronosclerospora sorghi]
MRLYCILISSAVSFLASCDQLNAQTTETSKAPPLNATQSKDYPNRPSWKSFQTNDLNTSEERMFSITRALDFDFAPELYKQWILSQHTPEHVRTKVLKARTVTDILQGEHYEQYLKFMARYNSDQELSKLQLHEFWLYAELTPDQVKDYILKIRPGESVWSHHDANQFLLYSVDYKESREKGRFTTVAKHMSLSALWSEAELTPSIVLEEILKVQSADDLAGRPYVQHQYHTFFEAYNNGQRRDV